MEFEPKSLGEALDFHEAGSLLQVRNVLGILTQLFDTTWHAYICVDVVYTASLHL